jgi:hypothetical protein
MTMTNVLRGNGDDFRLPYINPPLSRGQDQTSNRLLCCLINSSSIRILYPKAPCNILVLPHYSRVGRIAAKILH